MHTVDRIRGMLLEKLTPQIQDMQFSGNLVGIVLTIVKPGRVHSSVVLRGTIPDLAAFLPALCTSHGLIARSEGNTHLQPGHVHALDCEVLACRLGGEDYFIRVGWKSTDPQISGIDRDHVLRLKDIALTTLRSFIAAEQMPAEPGRCA